jgi:hypothetical protein
MQALLFDEYFAFRRIEAIHHRELLFARIPDLRKRVIAFWIRNKILMRF